MTAIDSTVYNASSSYGRNEYVSILHTSSLQLHQLWQARIPVPKLAAQYLEVQSHNNRVIFEEELLPAVKGWLQELRELMTRTNEFHIRTSVATLEIQPALAVEKNAILPFTAHNTTVIGTSGCLFAETHSASAHRFFTCYCC